VTSRARGTTKRILLADDDPVSRLLATRALEALGFEVEPVEDGEDALGAIERDRPDLVILDVEMPRLGGFEACTALRGHRATREIPVLIATSRADAETIDLALAAGASDFIKKPFDWQLLQHRVRFLLRASSAVQDLRRTLSDLSESRTRLANAQRIAKLGHWEWTPGTSRMTWSDQLYAMTGLERGRDSTTLAAFLAAIHPEDRSRVEKRFQEAQGAGNGWSFDHRLVRADGEVRLVRQTAEVETSPDGESERICGTLQDITDRRRAEEQIRALANTDDLTGLPNRRRLSEFLEKALDPSASHDPTLALLVLNLERFARVNDTLGHEGGDELLRAVTSRLVRCVESGDVLARVEHALPLARIGSDEFAILLKDVGSPAEASTAARRLLDTMSEPFVIGGNEIVMSARVGIAVCPDDGHTADELLRNANTAMHHARAERQGVHFFRSSMNDRAMRNLAIETGLRAALERDDLLLMYQPLCAPRTGEIIGTEVLVRWPSADFGLVMPSEFIPLAEESGFISRLGEWVLRHACLQGARWLREGVDVPRLSVNVSSLQLREPGLAALVRSTLADTGLPASLLEIEITESALLAHESSVSSNLAALREAGVRVALDDFGTGFSSLSHLIRYPIDTLKIDRSFVCAIGDGGQTDPLISAVVAMAHRLRLHVVAEGVETPEQEEFLTLVGCDALQGFRLGRPMPGEDLVPRLSVRAQGP
jgi:diguanylate cyclase (GGDEF)-like protein/PAS domain S-box-containing protein